jgi:hypothetical protein
VSEAKCRRGCNKPSALAAEPRPARVTRFYFFISHLAAISTSSPTAAMRMAWPSPCPGFAITTVTQMDTWPIRISRTGQRTLTPGRVAWSTGKPSSPWSLLFASCRQTRSNPVAGELLFRATPGHVALLRPEWLVLPYVHPLNVADFKGIRVG